MLPYRARSFSGTRLMFSRVKYHRNGISGQGFYSLEFIKKREIGDKVDRHMIGIVFPREDDSGELEPLQYSVIDRDNPALCWRGDHFLAAMRAAIKAASDSTFKDAEWQAQAEAETREKEST